MLDQPLTRLLIFLSLLSWLATAAVWCVPR